MTYHDMQPDHDRASGEQDDILAIPTEQEIEHLKQNSDQSELSQQEIEQAKGLDKDATAKAQGKTPLPAGERQDEDDDDDLLRADMVNAGD